MKNLLYLGFAALMLGGCAQPRQDQTDVQELKEQVAHLQAIQEQDEKKISQLAGQQAANSRMQNYDVQINPQTGLPEPAQDSPRSGLPEIDPSTGRPVSDELIALPPSGEVTETNSEYWRWTVKYAVGNPNHSPGTATVNILCTDASGHILDKDTELDLQISAYSTNTFTTYQFINLPFGAAVKSITDEIVYP
jgi:hypothetical protein